MKRNKNRKNSDFNKIILSISSCHLTKFETIPRAHKFKKTQYACANRINNGLEQKINKSILKTIVRIEINTFDCLVKRWDNERHFLWFLLSFSLEKGKQKVKDNSVGRIFIAEKLENKLKWFTSANFSYEIILDKKKLFFLPGI